VRVLAGRIGVAIEHPAIGIDIEIVELARRGDRMGAAKLYAERAGVDFAAAQRVVNAL
jgi:hypothetical protein